MVGKLIEYLSVFIALMIVLPVHEFAHAFVADKYGDYTPRVNGRLTLNPIAHVDLYGLLAIVLVRFGWGKPVPVNPNNFRKYKAGCFWVSIAGVLANYLLAFLTYPLFMLVIRAIFAGIIPDVGYFDDVLLFVSLYIPSLSINFCAFNLLPLYPLDGFKIVQTFNKKRGPIYRFLRDKGQYVLLGLLLLSVIADYTGLVYLDILGTVLGYMTDVMFYPITAFWGLIF
ncbi:MAG: site-2 protease family protein [Clostridia bacterium]|nr:site-2 protease family protein [Clostridia bacterium]